MKLLCIICLVLFFAACDNHAFESDKRQIIAKDEIRKMIPGSPSLSITNFREDTLTEWPDSAFRNPIRYTLQFSYKDAAGVTRNKAGTVVFSNYGNAVINSQLGDH